MSNTWHTHAANVMNPQLRKGHQGDTVHFGRGQLEKKIAKKFSGSKVSPPAPNLGSQVNPCPASPEMLAEYAVKWSCFM